MENRQATLVFAANLYVQIYSYFLPESSKNDVKNLAQIFFKATLSKLRIWKILPGTKNQLFPMSRKKIVGWIIIKAPPIATSILYPSTA